MPVHPITLRASGSIGGRRRGLLTKQGTPCVIAAAEPQDAPSQADGSGTMDVATWNIRSSRNLGLESGLWAVKAMEVDLFSSRKQS